MKRSVNGWRLTESTIAVDNPYGNYENPHRERVFVNVMPVDRTKEPVEYYAKYNDHNGPTEHIIVDTDLDAVIQAAEDWMNENPPKLPGSSDVQKTLS